MALGSVSLQGVRLLRQAGRTGTPRAPSLTPLRTNLHVLASGRLKN